MDKVIQGNFPQKNLRRMKAGKILTIIGCLLTMAFVVMFLNPLSLPTTLLFKVLFLTMITATICLIVAIGCLNGKKIVMVLIGSLVLILASVLGCFIWVFPFFFS